jgi:hypothetical protein
MVTAIVIPIICLYFFWLTRKEMEEHDIKWLAAGEVKQEAMLTGEIKSINEEKQRFYYHRYLYVQEIKLQSDSKIVKVRKVTPIRKNIIIEPFTIGEVIRIYGSWRGSYFHFSKFEQLTQKKVT